jgi:hypothetical protein
MVVFHHVQIQMLPNYVANTKLAISLNFLKSCFT